MAIPVISGGEKAGVLTAYKSTDAIAFSETIDNFLSTALGVAILEQLQPESFDVDATHGWQSRAKIHQATGMLMAQLEIQAEDAFALLRAHAYAVGISLSEVAAEIRENQIRFTNFTIDGD